MRRLFPPLEGVHPFRKTLGIFYIICAVFFVLARVSYDPYDHSFFSLPANLPTHNLAGSIGSLVATEILIIFGEAFWVIPCLLLYLAYRTLYVVSIFWPFFVQGIILSLVSGSILIHLFFPGEPLWAPSNGGKFGHYWGELILQHFGQGGLWILLSVCVVLTLMALEIYKTIGDMLSRPIVEPAPKTAKAPKIKKASTILSKSSPIQEDQESLAAAGVIPSMALPEESAPPEPVEKPKPSFLEDVRPRKKKKENEDVESAPAPVREPAPASKPRSKNEDGSYELPALALLDPAVIGRGDSEEFMQQRGQHLEEMFSNFKIGCRVIGMEQGPSITQFELAIDEGIRVSKITGLSDNIALTLRSPSVRVVAPIPGRNTIGVEIPNLKKELVNLRSIMESAECQSMMAKKQLALILGKDVAGVPLIGDLAKMPHLLVAGTTGSGKSVCINSIIISLIFYHKPEYVRLLMIDPKMVEMSGYEGIPHLMRPVITDMNEAAGVLEWACRRMDERYTLLTKYRVRNLETFNKLSKSKILEGLGDNENIEDIEWPMPFIVIIVDEFSDLMMVGAKEIEQYITRLAQKSRAVGIHVILATQRPSVDVITGLIKTNMPSRIAFQVAAKIDSRTILDQNGADKLLGKGDMLFLPPGSSTLVRAQGVMVTDQEINNLVGFWREQGEPQYIDLNEVSRVGGSGGASYTSAQGGGVDGGSADEDTYQKAVPVVLDSGRASASFIQRQLKIGYNKASRMIEMMEERGVVGPPKGSNRREILLSKEDWMNSEGLDADAPSDDN
ncbi:MAG: DNA translocase FtsK 4TM domain-containing protein [Planctomycetes bacterium]|nr:DNA translocase FtsK 4TM domain-containing protein [Planctomycetota bacterium]